ncbi:MAG TPA: hypothetical protein VK166_20195 [Chitinophagaceae bacterium]|nr:hypothetical protein [Chitinophagaceae bacterium]
MKKMPTIMLLLLLSVCGIAQVADTAKYTVRDELLQKSKRQKTAAFVMLGVGTLAAVTGSIIFSENFDIWDDSNDALMGTGAILATAGGLSMLGSIPLFIASSKNKGRAMGMSAGIKMEKAFPDGVFRNNLTYYPAASIRIGIK